MQRKYVILFIILVTVFTGFFANAQVRNTDIILNISPLYPAPNQNVTAVLNSYVINLDKANISWSINNQEVSGGIGKKSFSFKTESSSLINLSVSIETVDGQSLTKTITITPTNVDMLWEAEDSYAPPFYKGKTLVASQGKFKVVAMPNLMTQNGKVNANNLSYTWTKDGNVKSNSSGWGKSYLIFQNSYLDKGNMVEVKVSDIFDKTSALGTINLQTINPKIIFYKNDPVFGVKWEESLNNGFRINQNGETIIAEPYFFSPKNISSSKLSFKWSLNGEIIETPNPKNILSIKPEAGQTGNAVIKLMIENVGTLFQSMEKQIQVSF